MTSPLLALFTRSLREDARSRLTYWTRGGLSCLLMLLMLIFATPGFSIPAPGRYYFTTVIVAQTLAITFVGLSYFGSAVTEEKEEHTLGLLRMTGLNPLSILLGKSTSRLCGALLLLIAQFPFTIFAITLGGISLGQIVAVYCTLAAYVFLLCNFALLGSVLARTTGGAVTFCVVVTAVFSGALWALTGIQKLASHIVHLPFQSVASAVWDATLIARLVEVLGTGFQGAPAGWQVASNLILGVVFFLLAWAAFERSCDHTAEESVSGAARVAPRPSAPQPTGAAQTEVIPPRSRFSLFGSFQARPPRPWKNALRWKDFYFLCGGRRGFILRVVCYGGLLINDVFAMSFGTGASSFGFNGSANSLLPLAFAIDAGIMASRIFGAELRDHTLGTLAMLPCDMRYIVRQKVLACAMAAAPGAFCAVVAQILVSVYLGNQYAGNGASAAAPILQEISSCILFVLVLFVTAWLSLYMKRGAFAVGFVATYMVNMVLVVGLMAAATAGAFMRVSTLTGSGSGGIGSMVMYVYVQPVLACIMNIVAIVLFYRHGLARLESLAGEG